MVKEFLSSMLEITRKLLSGIDFKSEAIPGSLKAGLITAIVCFIGATVLGLCSGDEGDRSFLVRLSFAYGVTGLIVYVLCVLCARG